MNIWQRWPLILLSTTLFASTPAMAQDQDSDGIPDNQDNCLLAANPDQFDSNGDGYGSACDPDLDNNGIVNFLDLQQIRIAFFQTPVGPNWNPDADFNNDSIINFLDLLVMRNLFFRPPGPVGLVRWINPESGDWNVPTNWFPVGVPIAPNFVLIDTPGIVVTHDSGDNECSGVLSEADIALSDGSSLSVFGDMDMQGTLIMTDSSTALRNARIFRTVASEGPAPMTFESNVILDNITLGFDLIIPNGFVVRFDNGLTLENTNLTLISNNSFTQAQFRGTQTIGGTGEVLFGGTTANDTLNRLYANGSGEVLTIGPGITVRTLTTGGWLGTNSPGRGLNVLGSVVTDVADAKITVQGEQLTIDGSLAASNGGDITVNGEWTASTTATMTATGGSELELFGNWSSEATVSVTDGLLDISNNNNNDSWTNLGAITLLNSDAELGGVFGPDDIGPMTISGITSLNGRLILTGLTFDVDTAPGTWQLATSGIIQDGTVTGTLLDVVGSGTLDGTTLGVDTVVNNGVLVDVINGLTLDDASFTLISNNSFTQARFSGTQTLGGTGEILYGGTTANDTLNRLYANGGGDVLTIGPGISARTLTTGGWLGTNSPGRGLNVLGSVVTDVADAKITVQGEQLTIDGSLAASNGGDITVNGEWTASTTATMTATGGSELELFGDWISEATVSVTDGLLDIGNNNNSDTWANLGEITLINSDAEFGGVFVPDDIGNTTISGITSLNGRLILTGLTFDVDTAPGTWQLATSGIIQDGTVTGTLLDVVGSGTLDGTTLGVDTVVNNGVLVDVINGLTLDDASFTLISNNSFTQARFSGTQTLGGTGEILYGGTTANDTLNRLYANGNGDVLTIGPGITARTLTTGGWLGTNAPGRGLNILGDVVADVAGAVLTVQGDVLTLDASLTGSGGSSITINGDWIASAATTIAMSGGGTLDLLGSWSSEAAVTVTDSFLDIGNNSTEMWTNLGSIDLVNSDATFGGSFMQSNLGTITSNGIVTVDGLLDNTGQTLNVDTLPGTWQLGTGTISGGTIAGLTFDVIGSGGTLDGVTLSADMDVTNGALLTLTNGLTFAGSATMTLTSNNSFTQVRANGSQTVGGTGTILFGGTTTNDTLNRFYANANGDTLTIGPDVTVMTGSTGGWLGTNAVGRGLSLEGSVTANLAGRKVAILGDPITISGTAVAGGGANLQISGDWTATPAATISMSGGGELELFGQWVSSGSITVTGSLLDIGNNSTTDLWTNLGTIDLIGSDAELGGAFVFGDVGVLTSNATMTIDGEFDNTGQTLDLDTLPGTWELGNGEIIGGTIAGTSFLVHSGGDLNDVTLSADTTIGNGSTSFVTNGLTLDNVSLTLASDNGFTILRFSGSQTLDGTGEVLFGGTTTNDTLNRIEPNGNGDTLTIGPNITIRPLTTGGFVGSTSVGRATILQGSLVSDMAGEVVTVNGRPFTNNGSVIVDAGSVIAGTTDYVQGGGGSLQVEVNGTATGEFGRIAMTGGSSAALNGTLDIVRTVTPGLSDTFEIISAGSRSGTFTTVTGTDAGNGNTFVPIYNADNVTLQVQ